jgi:hypothetical protein
MEASEYDHRAVEAAARALWEQREVYRYDRDGEDAVFSVDTPPPYVSAAHLHVGHAMSYSGGQVLDPLRRCPAVAQRQSGWRRCRRARARYPVSASRGDGTPRGPGTPAGDRGRTPAPCGSRPATRGAGTRTGRARPGAGRSAPEVGALIALITTINAWHRIGVSSHAWEPGSYQP